MAITNLILVRCLKFQHIWLKGEILHWFLPKKIMKNDHLTTIDHKKFFQTNKLFDKTNFLMKETFKWKKLFNEYAFWKNKLMYQQNHFFDDEKNFSTKQTLNMLLSQNVENWRILDIIDNFWKIIDKFWILSDNFPKIIDNFQSLLIISKIFR